MLCLISGGASALLPAAGAADHAGREAGDHPAAARLRREHPRDQRRPQAHLAHQGRPTGAAGGSGRGRVAAALRRDRRRSRRDRLRPDRARRLHVRRRCAILEKYGIRDRVPAPVRERLEAGMRGEIAGDAEARRPAVRARAQHGGRQQPAGARCRRRASAQELGYRTLVLSSEIEGETRDIARMHAAIAREIARTGRPLRPPACIITGGETTVTIKGDGLGGRNQEFVLAAAIDIAGLPEHGGVQRRHRRHRRPHRRGRRHRRRRDARAAIPTRARFLDANDSYHYFERWATW